MARNDNVVPVVGDGHEEDAVYMIYRNLGECLRNSAVIVESTKEILVASIVIGIVDESAIVRPGDGLLTATVREARHCDLGLVYLGARLVVDPHPTALVAGLTLLPKGDYDIPITQRAHESVSSIVVEASCNGKCTAEGPSIVEDSHISPIVTGVEVTRAGKAPSVELVARQDVVVVRLGGIDLRQC